MKITTTTANSAPFPDSAQVERHEYGADRRRRQHQPSGSGSNAKLFLKMHRERRKKDAKDDNKQQEHAANNGEYHWGPKLLSSGCDLFADRD